MVKNSRKAILVAGLLLLVAALHGQSPEFSVSWGKEFDAHKSSLQDIIGYDESGFYALKDRGTFSGPAFSIDHLDYALNFDKSTDLEIQEGGKNCQVQTVLQIKDGLYVFYSFLNNKEKKKILFVDELDKVTLKLKQQKIKLGEIDFSGNSKRHSGSFSVKLSRDGSKVLVFYSMPDSKGDPESFGVNVLDVELHSLWEKTFTMPYAGGLFDIESVRVDNEGNLYLLGLVYKEKRASKRKGLPNYSYEVFSYSDKGNSTKQYPVSLDDRFITDMQIQILDNNLVCGGFYSEKGTFSIRGTYFLTIDLTSKEIKTKSFNEFGIDFISQSMSQRDEKIARKEEEKGKDPELFEYSLDQLLIGSDGSALLVGEQYYVRVVTTTTTMNGQKSVRHHYHYYYNDIIAVKINPAGQIEWAQKVAKSQHTIDDRGYYSSYALAASKGKTWFIFNDNPKNMDYDGEGRPANFNSGKSEAVIVGLDSGGKQTKQAIFGSGDVEVMIRPKVCEQISGQDVILFGQRSKMQQFSKLTFN